MKANALKAQLLPPLLAGTGRQPLNFAGGLDEVLRPEDPKAALYALSLTAQALRFERPLPPPSFVTEATIKDERAIMPEHLRRPLLRPLPSRRQDSLWAFPRCADSLFPDWPRCGKHRWPRSATAT